MSFLILGGPMKNQFEKQVARREALYKILPTSKERALTKAQLYERLTSTYPTFKAQQKPGSEPRWQYKTIQRDLMALCFDGKIARYKSSGASGKNDMFNNSILDQIDQEDWIDLTIRGCATDAPKDRKEAIKSLKDIILEAVKKSLEDSF